jgi:MFS superfamily sulfate permease-like transporter
VHTVILDLDANDDLDITSSEVLEKLAAALGRQHVRLALAHLHAPARDMLTHFGLTGEGAAAACSRRSSPSSAGRCGSPGRKAAAGRITQRKPRWAVDVSTASPWRAAGR